MNSSGITFEKVEFVVNCVMKPDRPVNAVHSEGVFEALYGLEREDEKYALDRMNEMPWYETTKKFMDIVSERYGDDSFWQNNEQ